MSELDEYIANRIRPRMAFYDQRAVRYKLISRLLQFGSVGLSIAVLLLIHEEQVPRLLVAALAAVVALAVGIESAGQFGTLWQLYRISNELLGAELQMVKYGAGPYRGEVGTRVTLLVDRCEHIMAFEANRWRGLIEGGAAAAHRGSLPGG